LPKITPCFGILTGGADDWDFVNLTLGASIVLLGK